MNSENKKFWDKSTTLLVISNIITIIFAVLEGWDLNKILWVYWFQSVIIGYFNYKRILKLEKFTTKDLTMNNQPVAPTERSKKFIANFFLMHYSFFHFVYFIFLMGNISFFYKGQSTIIFFAISVVIFYFNHRISFKLNYQEDLKGRVNIGTLMLMPYARIIPMHFIVGFGILSVQDNSGLTSMDFTLIMLLFLTLKTIADVVMHKVEHNYLRKNYKVDNSRIIIKN
jgi:hypothetical protein